MDLHVFFFPYLAPGHMNPMVDLARFFANRGVKATIITTTGNLCRIQPTIDHANANFLHPIRILTIPFASSKAGLPEGHENFQCLPTPELFAGFEAAIALLENPVRLLVESHRPDFIVADSFYRWASDLGIPKIEFNPTGFFNSVVMRLIIGLKLYTTVSSDDEPFIVPNIPHRIEVSVSQLCEVVMKYKDHIARMYELPDQNYGMVMNSFYDLETIYVDSLKQTSKTKLWNVGPVSHCHGDDEDRAVRGDKAAMETEKILDWLNHKIANSVLYICFGSLGKFTTSQLAEIVLGLETSNVPFVWVVDAKLPEGFEERVVGEGKGLIIKGWAPQILILNHFAVGGFMTHCGWNSCLEGASAGVPMITWPLFSEQFINEKLIVDVLRIGVSVGSKMCRAKEEDRTLVGAEAVRTAVEELMGSGEEAEGRRERARDLGVKAREAIEEGGSSYNEMTSLIEDLMAAKAAKVKSEQGTNQSLI